jgi:mRNA-degrading endonuclease RelE of RelBE toxin-antitoxin system
MEAPPLVGLPVFSKDSTEKRSSKACAIGRRWLFLNEAMQNRASLDEKSLMSAKREIVWSVSARITLGSLPEPSRKSLEALAKKLADVPFPAAITGRLHKVKKTNEPNMHYMRFGTIYRVLLDIFPDRVEILAIVDHKAMTQLVRSIDRV